MKSFEIDALLKRRDEAVARLVQAQGAVVTRAQTLVFEARLTPEFRRYQIDVLRVSLRQIEEAINKLETVIQETDAVFDAVAEQIG